MDKELKNQQFEAEDDDLFPEEPEDDEGIETEEEPEEQPEKPKGFMKVKYNGEDRDLNEEETRTYAQKGMNYDKVKGSLDELERGGARKAIEIIRNLADENGMSVEEYMDFAEKNISAGALNAAMREISKQHPGLPEDVVKELAENRVAKKREQSKADREERENAPWAELAEAYPDLKPDEIPDEVREAIANGKSPLLAMREHELDGLKRERDAAKQNETVRKKAVGGLGKDSGGAAKDPFLEGLLGS